MSFRSLTGWGLPSLTATPTSPANGVSLYTKADNKVYRLTSAGVETPLGFEGGAANPNAALTGAPRLYRYGSMLSTRIVGANIYDLLLSDKTSVVGRLSTAEVQRRLDAAKDMGANTVRTHAWISVGKTGTLMPTLGSYDEAAFVALDVIVAEARKRSLLLWAPVTDRWNFYHGGMITFAQLVAGNTNQTDAAYRTLFYTDAATIAQFKTYLTAILTRTNTITGIRYVDDPTLAVIETVNEGFDAPAAWTDSILAHLRTIAPSTLLADGCNAASGRYPDGTDSANTQAGPSSLVRDCDIVGGHFYDNTARDAGWLDRAALMAATAAAPKVYVVGEWSWIENANGVGGSTAGVVSRAAFCARMEANQNVQGDFFWSLFTDTVGATHDDGYQLFTPPQNSEQANGLDDLTRHAWRMRASDGKPASSPIVNPFYGDTFDSTGALDTGKWLVYTAGAGASAARSTNQAVLVTGTAGAYASKATMRSTAPVVADRRVTFTVTPTNITDEAYFRVELRGQGVGAAIDGGDGYALEVSNTGSIGVKARLVGVDTTPKAGIAIAGWAAGVAQRIEFEVVGRTINVRYWLSSGGTRPVAPTWTATDTKVSAPGATGVTLNCGNAVTSVTWQVDDWVVADYLDSSASVFSPGTLLMRGANGLCAEPYSDSNPPFSLDRTISAVTVPTPAAGFSGEWTSDAKSLDMKAPDGTVTRIGPGAAPGVLSTEYITTTPASPVTGVTLFTRNKARRLPAFVGPTGLDSSLQPSLFSNRVAATYATNGVAGMTGGGGFPLANYGTPSSVLNASTSFFAAMVRTRYTSAATAQALAGIKSASTLWFRSSIANAGGFFFVARFGLATTAATNRVFVGLVSSATQTLATDPSTLLDAIGFSADSAQTTLRFSTNDGTGTATQVDLGVNFPAQTAATNFYEVRLFTPSGSSGTVFWSAQRLNDGVLVQGSATVDLPTVGALLSAHVVHGNGATAAAVAIDVQTCYIETDN